ncbi:MAG: glutamine amidotransferase [Verrucomicrobiota bacterium]
MRHTGEPRKPPKARVLYLGDWFFNFGSVFIQTPFGMEARSYAMHFSGTKLVQALEPHAEVNCLASWELHRLQPGRFETMLKKTDIVIVSDCEAKHFQLYPSFFEVSSTRMVVPSYPDRLVSLKNWVAAGGGLMMLGGWLSFSGMEEKAGWRRTPTAEALPVSCLIGDDRVDSSAGFTPEVLMPNHGLIKGLPWRSFPRIFGYNEVVSKPGSNLLVRVRETGHPLLVTGEWGRGRICVYASDPAPYWGINFEQWEGYGPFWRRVLAWLLDR